MDAWSHPLRVKSNIKYIRGDLEYAIGILLGDGHVPQATSNRKTVSYTVMIEISPIIFRYYLTKWVLKTKYTHGFLEENMPSPSIIS